MPPLRDPEQKLHPGHRAVAGADAGAGLNQMLLKIAHIIWLSRLRRPPQPGREPLANPQMTNLRRGSQIARRHIRDHAGARERDVCSVLNVHGKTLCQPRQNHLDQQQTPNLTIRETNPD